jgi:hypothetical protein
VTNDDWDATVARVEADCRIREMGPWLDAEAGRLGLTVPQLIAHVVNVRLAGQAAADAWLRGIGRARRRTAAAPRRSAHHRRSATEFSRRRSDVGA